MASSEHLAGDVDYARHGQGYALRRRTDPRIAALVHRGLGSARTVLNIGAGAGSYEPEDRHVIAIEPSAAMRAQRPRHLSPAVCGEAEQLPLDDQFVDASMALVTVHQWRDLTLGLNELGRVTRGPIVVLTFDGVLERFWLADYVPELIAAAPLSGDAQDCRGAWRGDPNYESSHPHRLRGRVYRGLLCASGEILGRGGSAVAIGVELRKRRSPTAIRRAPRRDLQPSRWDRQYGDWRTKPHFEGSVQLIVSGPDGRR